MTPVSVIGAGAIGAIIGSFLNVVIHRLPRGESLSRPGSHCSSCGASVAPYDNVPVLSWLLLRGRCRDCAASISARYPLVEVLTAVLLAAVVAARGFVPELALWLPLVAGLVACAAIDLEHRLIPNRITGPLAALGLAGAIAVRGDEAVELAAAGAGAFVFLLIPALLRPGGMGMGDVKLAGVIGLFLGVWVIPALLVAFTAGSLVGGFLIAREGPGARKRAVPFGPFLALGAVVGLLAGPELIDLYTGLAFA
jgi:leader peptidase (prepilin peptidase)/N-methyltransferase